MRRNLRRSVEKEGVQEFVFCNASHCDGSHQPHWEKNDEFDLDGHLYDVIKKEKRGDSLYIRCISDEKETELLKRYLALSKDDFSGKTKKRSVSLLKMLNGFVSFFSAQETCLVFSLPAIADDNYQFHLSYLPHEVLIPPPRC